MPYVDYHRRRRTRPLSRPPLWEFVFLSMLLHALAIALFGAPSGGSREGRAMWGSLQVVLRPPALPPAPAPVLKVERKLAAPRPPAPARKAPPAPKAPPAVPPMLDRLVPDRDLDLAPLPKVPPPTENQLIEPIEVPQTQPPEPEPPAPEPPMPPPPTPTPPAEVAPIETPVLPVPDTTATPPVESTPVEVPALPVPQPESAAPTASEPAEKPEAASQVPSVAPPAPTPAAPPPPAPTPPTTATPTPSPTPETPPTPATAIAPPAAVEPPSPFHAPPSPDYDPTAGPSPTLDLDAIRRRAGEIAREGSGQAALLPFPMPPVPPRKSKMETAIENAHTPDCRTRYQALGLAAVVPLIANELGERKCRW